LKREAKERLDEDNAFEGKTTQDCHLYLQPSKRLETYLSYKRGLLK